MASAATAATAAAAAAAASPLPRPRLTDLLVHNPCQPHKALSPSLVGSIDRSLDKDLHKLAFEIKGTVASSNYISPHNDVFASHLSPCLNGGLNLPASYLYLLLRTPSPSSPSSTSSSGSKPLTLHLDFVTRKGSNFRVTVSTFYKDVSMAGASTLRVPLALFTAKGGVNKHFLGPPPDAAPAGDESMTTAASQPSSSSSSSSSWSLLSLNVSALSSLAEETPLKQDPLKSLFSYKVCSYTSVFGLYASETAFSKAGFAEISKLDFIMKPNPRRADKHLVSMKWFPKAPTKGLYVPGEPAQKGEGATNKPRGGRHTDDKASEGMTSLSLRASREGKALEELSSSSPPPPPGPSSSGAAGAASSSPPDAFADGVVLRLSPPPPPMTTAAAISAPSSSRLYAAPPQPPSFKPVLVIGVGDRGCSSVTWSGSGLDTVTKPDGRSSGGGGPTKLGIALPVGHLIVNLVQQCNQDNKERDDAANNNYSSSNNNNDDLGLSFSATSNNTTALLLSGASSGSSSIPQPFSQTFLPTPSKISLIGSSVSGVFLAACSESWLRLYCASSGRLLASVSEKQQRRSSSAASGASSHSHSHHHAAGAAAAADVAPSAPPLPPVDLSISLDDNLLSVVGFDAQRKLVITIYDISTLREYLSDANLRGPVDAVGGARDGFPKKSLPIVARQSSDFPITKLKFTPYGSGARLVSCGRENVRFWRIKQRHLPACPAILNEFARGVSFNDLAFESSYGMLDDAAASKIVFVATSIGTLLQISVQTRNVLCVLKLHSGPINCLAVNEGYCVTGSDDSYLRLWPLDFSSYLLEAAHPSAVSSVSLSLDGLKLLVGTVEGTVGVLDVVTQKYDTVMRSHQGAVNCVAHDKENGGHRQEIATVGEDKTIRVWDVITGSQKYEFLSPADAPTVLAYHPHEQTIAIGFSSGTIRIFDVTSTRMIFEMLQHTAPIKSLIFSSDGGTLYAAAMDGHISIFAPASDYLPIKTIAADIPANSVLMSLSDDNRWLVAIGPEKSTCLTVYYAETIVPHRKLVRKGAEVPVGFVEESEANAVVEDDPASQFKAVFFHENNRDVVAFTGKKLMIYSNVANDVAGGGRSKMASESLPLPNQQVANCIAKSPCGRFYAASCAKPNDAAISTNIVYVWKFSEKGGDTATKSLREVKRCAGHYGSARSLTFSPNGMKLIASDDTGVLTVWDVSDLDGLAGDSSSSFEQRSMQSTEAAPVSTKPEESTPTKSSDPRSAIRALAMPTPPLPERPKKSIVAAEPKKLDPEILKEHVYEEKKDSENEEEDEDEDEDEEEEEGGGGGREFVESGDDDGDECEYNDDDDDDDDDDVSEDFERTPYDLDNPELSIQDDRGRSRSDMVAHFEVTKVSGFDGFPKHNLLWNAASGLLLSSLSNYVVVEDLEDSSQRVATHQPGSLVTAIVSSSDGSVVVSGSTSSEGSVRVWSSENFDEPSHELTIHDDVGVEFLCLTRNEELLVSVSFESYPESKQKLHVWDLSSARTLAMSLTNSKNEVTTCICGIASYSSYAFASGCADGIALWSVDEPSDSSAGVLRRSGIHLAVSPVTALCANDDAGEVLIAGSKFGDIVFYSVSSSSVLRKLHAFSSSVVSTLTSRPNRLIASSGGSVRVWDKLSRDLELGSPRDVQGIRADDITSMHWDDEGVDGVFGTRSNARFGAVKYVTLLPQAEEGICKAECLDLIGSRFPPHTRVAFAPDEKFLALCDGRTMKLLDSASLRELCALDLSREVEGCCQRFTVGSYVDGKGSVLMAASYDDGSIVAARINTMKKFSVEVGKTMGFGTFAEIAFVDGDSQLAVGSDSGDLCLIPVNPTVGSKAPLLGNSHFDLLKHQKNVDGEFIDPVDWTWTSIASNPIYPSVWCCCNASPSESFVYVYEDGILSHTIPLVANFAANNVNVSPTSTIAKFSTTRPHTLVCVASVPEGVGTSWCATYRLGDANTSPTLMSIVNLDNFFVESVLLSDCNVMALGSDEGSVLVLTEDECELVQCIDEEDYHVGEEDDEDGGGGAGFFAMDRGATMLVKGPFGGCGVQSFTRQRLGMSGEA